MTRLLLALLVPLVGASCRTEAPSDDGRDAAPGGVDAVSTGELEGGDLGGSDVPAQTGAPGSRCGTETGDYCVAVAGTINGRSFDFNCLPANRDLVSLTAARFALTCHDASQTLTFRVAVPEKGVGTFDLPAVETQAAVADLEMLKMTDEPTMAQMNSTAANLWGGAVQVTASADRLRFGSFEGSWRAADAGCRSFTYSCASGSLRGSFRFRRPPP
jgi:hypothetical protein